MREICIAGIGVSYLKNSILRRVPYRKFYFLLRGRTNRYIGDTSVHGYFPTTQLKICKVS